MHVRACLVELTCFLTKNASPSVGASVSSRTIRRHLAEEHLGSWCPLCVLPLTNTHRRLHLEWCCTRGNWTAAGWNQVIFSDESRFSLNIDGNHVRVWRPRGECLNPALQRHTAPTADVRWYVHDILQTHVLQLMQRLPRAVFEQDNVRSHTASVSQDCTTFPWPAQSPDLSPIEHIWDHLGWRVGHPTSLNELQATLKQIWK
ncbi:transposable element Tcb2 transposase [Trichonephila clavipes]|nr:transposable element Tcb2 transposase [Trichonephila clavipes]